MITDTPAKIEPGGEFFRADVRLDAVARVDVGLATFSDTDSHQSERAAQVRLKMSPDKFYEETPFFTDAHERLAAGVGAFAAREIGPRADEDDAPDAQFREMLGLLAQAGLLRHAIAKDAAGLDPRSLCIVREVLAYHSTVADAAFMVQGVGTYPIALAAPDHVRDFWVQRATEGRAVAAFALTEPEAGSDVSALRTTARLEGDAYVINGHKTFVSNAGVADFYTVFARTGTRESDGRALLSAFIVGLRLPGFRVSARRELIGSQIVGEIEMENLRVPIENRIGAEGEGFNLAMRTLDAFRASVGAAACGMARRALDETIAHARRRQQFGAALGQFQLIQEQLADMATELDAARLLVYQAAYQSDAARASSATATRAVSAAKLFATEAACRITDRAVQIHGAQGLLRGSVVERLHRDVRALRIYGGTSEIQKLVIAGQLLKAETNA